MNFARAKYTILISAATFLLGLGGGAALSCLGTSSDTKDTKPAPPAYAFETKIAEEGTRCIQALPPICRAAIISSRFGLCFTPTGSTAYDHLSSYSPEEKVQYYGVRNAAQLVDYEGKVHKFFDVLRMRDKDGDENHQLWIKAMQCIGASSDEAVFAPLQADIKLLAQLAAKHHLSSMPKEFRQAWLAEQAHLFFSENDEPFYTGKQEPQFVPGTNHKFVVREVNDKAKYADSKGKIQVFSEVYNKVQQAPRARVAWTYASYCAAIVGKDAIFELYPKELKRLKKARAAAVK